MPKNIKLCFSKKEVFYVYKYFISNTLWTGGNSGSGVGGRKQRTAGIFHGGKSEQSGERGSGAGADSPS